MSKVVVHIVKSVHRKQNVYLARYDYNRKAYALLKKLDFTHWSNTRKCWYFKQDVELVQTVIQLLKENDFQLDLSLYTAPKVILPANEDLIKKFDDYLLGLRLSNSTISTYTGIVRSYAYFLENKNLLSSDDIDFRSFIQYTIKQLDYSVSTHRQIISAFKHFTQLNPQLQLTVEVLKRPKRSRFMPQVLAMEEVIKILQVTSNLKHRFIIAMLYSCGLRISELLSMQTAHIDLHRRQVHVKNAKGRKDRYVGIAQNMDALIHNYLNTYQPYGYLIEGKAGKPYSASSIRAFLKTSCRKAGIKKTVTPHTLRHSYATHMIENGVGLRYVQELLGHSKPETTMLYTHIARKDLIEINNPLDLAIAKANKDKIISKL